MKLFLKLLHYATIACQVLIIGAILAAAMLGLSQILFGVPA